MGGIVTIPVMLAAASATAAAASGVVGYVGAQNQAKAMEGQAKRAQQMGVYNQSVARNQGIAQQQDLNYQSGVAKFNQAQALQDRDRQMGLRQDSLEKALASSKATGSRRGTFDYSFDDILRAEEDFQNEAFLNEFASASQEAYGYSAQAKQNTFMGDRAIEVSNQQGLLASNEGYARSTSLNNQASSARIGSYGKLAGGLGSAAGAMSGINYGGSWKPTDWSMR